MCFAKHIYTAPPKKRKSLGRFIGAFKTVSTKQIYQLRKTPGHKIWQRNFHDQIVRGEADLNRIRQYIKNNPLSWSHHEE